MSTSTAQAYPQYSVPADTSPKRANLWRRIKNKIHPSSPGSSPNHSPNSQSGASTLSPVLSYSSSRMHLPFVSRSRAPPSSPSDRSPAASHPPLPHHHPKPKFPNPSDSRRRWPHPHDIGSLSTRPGVPSQPLSWQQYNRMYAAGYVNIKPPVDVPENAGDGADPEDIPPPVPPKDHLQSQQPLIDNPYTRGFYPAPRPLDESKRQRAVKRLDLFSCADPPPSFTARGVELPSTFPSPDGMDEAERNTHMQQVAAGELLDTSKVPPHAWPRTDRSKLYTRQDKASPPTESHPLSTSLSDCAAFRRIVRHTRRVFQAKTCMLSVLDHDQQLFLAESGLGSKAIPREISFCAHTILAGNEGFVVLDAHEDWRFKDSMMVKGLGARFYAGVPLYTRDLSGADQSDTEYYPIGTLCVADIYPRETFTDVEREELIWLAGRARLEIEKWYLARQEAKKSYMDSRFDEWKNNAPPPSLGCRASGERAPAVIESTTNHAKKPSIQVNASRSKKKQLAEHGKVPDASHEVEAQKYEKIGRQRTTSPYIDGIGDFETAQDPDERSENAITAEEGGTANDEDRTPQVEQIEELQKPASDDETGAPVSPYSKVFETAVQLLQNTLDLTLAYLVVMDFKDEYATIEHGAPLSVRLEILAASGLPEPAPSFDITLHIRALRAPEGGLLYQNNQMGVSGDQGPSSVQLKDGEYASAILVPVDEVENAAKGYVLAAFTRSYTRSFGMDDLRLMRKVAAELKPYVETHAWEGI